MGRELRFRGAALHKTIWAAGPLITNPEMVEQVHIDYIRAGADIITTNTYGIIRTELAKEGIEERFEELNLLACTLAQNARKKTDRDVLIAGSLPPLRGSYRPDLVGPLHEIEPLYREQARILTPFVDLFICETMSSGTEALAAATAAIRFGKPVWVAWTLFDDHSGKLRSGESVEQAMTKLSGINVTGCLANCCAPESIEAFLENGVQQHADWVGGYANTFSPVPTTWTLSGDGASDGLLPLREDLSPDSYGHFVRHWLQHGANVVGGCCGTRPAHTAVMRAILDEF